ncbi:sigma-54-dependent transcriptional regulator [Massilia consociata]|uniref:Sigma-54-dependent transcriptional regulator n=1 Tax=Massilia consociata TaxID=760117 RepID=A0ABV6FL43_9BURK
MTPPSRPAVLLADDQREVREALRLLLKSEGIASENAASPGEALECLRRHEFSCALIDCNFSRGASSGDEGMDLLRKIKQASPDLPVVVMTAWGNIPLTVEAMRHGAADFIEKPWENARVLQVLRAQIALSEGARRQRRLEAENALLRGAAGNPEIIAESPAMHKVMMLVERIAASDANVLVLGENGTGKGAVAQLLHDRSARATRSLVKVNMGGISETVFESEMFGHARGAFTDARTERVGRFELADGGTLFLDEVGNLPLSQQPKLLRVLEDGEFERLGSSRTQRVDVRLIAATNADLAQEVDAGRFRRDLLYRLNTLEIRLPPLRERSQDILPLARAFLARHAARYRRDGLRLSPAAERALLAWHWPGNVRELQHLMERAVLLSDHEQVDADVLGLAGSARAAHGIEDMTLEQAEAWLVQRALKRHRGNAQQAADMLGITRQSLYRRLEKHDLRPEDDDARDS